MGRVHVTAGEREHAPESSRPPPSPPWDEGSWVALANRKTTAAAVDRDGGGQGRWQHHEGR